MLIDDYSEWLIEQEEAGNCDVAGRVRDPQSFVEFQETIPSVPDRTCGASRRNEIAAQVLVTRQPIDARMRDMLFDAAGGSCVYCGREKATTLDHVVPLARNGKHAPSNLVAACRDCNSSKNVNELVKWATRKFGASEVQEILGRIEDSRARFRVLAQEHSGPRAGRVARRCS